MFTRLAKEAREKAKKLEGRDNISSIIQKKYLEDLAKELEHQLNADFANLKKNLEQDMTQVSESVIDCIKEFEESVGMPISNSWLNIPVDAVEAVQSGKIYAGNWTLSSRIWGMERKVIKDIHTVIAEGIAANKSAYDIAKDLEKYVDPKAKKDWNWSKVYPGTNRKVDYSAQRLARTMVSHAYQFSFVESTKDNPFIAKYKWISSHDKKVCPICKERDGKLFDKDKLPLDHPNGRCTFVSVFEKSATQISDEMVAWAKGKDGDFPKIDEYMKKKFGTDRYEKAMQMAQQGMKQEVIDEQNFPQFESMSESKYKEWQKENSTLQNIYSEFEKKWGVKLHNGVLPSDQDRLVEVNGEKEWLYDILRKSTEEYYIAVGTAGSQYSYVQNAEWSNNINRYWRTGDALFLKRIPRGKITKKKAEELYIEDIAGIKKVSNALDSLISKSKIDKNIKVDRWGGINSLESLGISYDLNTVRVGHAFVTQGIDLEAVKSKVDEMIGSIMVDNGYMSASVSSDLNVFKGSDIKFSINVQKGTNAFITDNVQESEIIFERGTKTEIVGSRIIETEAFDSWTGEKVKTKTLEIILNMIK